MTQPLHHDRHHPEPPPTAPPSARLQHVEQHRAHGVLRVEVRHVPQELQLLRRADQPALARRRERGLDGLVEPRGVGRLRRGGAGGAHQVRDHQLAEAPEAQRPGGAPGVGGARALERGTATGLWRGRLRPARALRTSAWPPSPRCPHPPRSSPTHPQSPHLYSLTFICLTRKSAITSICFMYWDSSTRQTSSVTSG